MVEWRNDHLADRDGFEIGKEDLVLEDAAVHTIENLKTRISQNTPDCVPFPDTIKPQVSIQPIYCSYQYLHKLEIKDYPFQSGLLYLFSFCCCLSLKSTAFRPLSGKCGLLCGTNDYIQVVFNFGMTCLYAVLSLTLNQSNFLILVLGFVVTFTHVLVLNPYVSLFIIYCNL